MAAPFRFLDRIDVLVDGPASVLTTVRQLVLPGGDRPMTRASCASRIPADDVRRHVVGVTLDVVTERVRDGLVEALREHLDEVRAEYEMLEGECPAYEDAARQWDVELRDAYAAVLREGDVAVALDSWIEHLSGAAPAERIADAVLAAPVADPDAVLARVGVGSADVDALVAEIRKAHISDDVSTRYPVIDAALHRAELAEEGRSTQGPQQLDYAGEKLPVGSTRDPQHVQIQSLDKLAMHVQIFCMEADAPSVACLQEGVTYVLTDPDMVATGAELLGLAGDAAFLAWAEERLMTSTPQEDAAAVAEVLRLAGANAEGGDDAKFGGAAIDIDLETAVGGDEGVSPAALHIGDVVETPKGRHVIMAVSPAEESNLTRAVGAALAALYDHGCETDKAMAEALGVPKTTINHSRHGKASWAPSSQQLEWLGYMVARHADALAAARRELTEAGA